MTPKIRSNNSIRNKLVYTYIIAMGSALVITFMVLVIVVNIDTEKKLYNSDLQSTKVFSKYIKIKMDEIKNISLDMVKDSKLQKELISKEDNKNELIQGVLNSFLLNNNDIDAIYLVDNNDNVYIADSEPFYDVNKQNFLDLSPSKNIIDQKGGAYHYISKKGYMDNSKSTIAVSRAIVSKDDFSKLGYITIYIKRDVLDRMYREFTDYMDLDFIVSDELGNQLIFSLNENNEDKNEIQVIKYNNSKYSKVSIDGKVKSSVVDKFELLSGYIIVMSNSKSTSEYILIVLILLVVLNVVFLIVYNIYVSKYVINPLDKIVEDSKKIGFNGELNRRFKVEGSYLELDYIINALNDMMDKINDLIGEIKVKQKLQNKLELDRLNSQIKPHFLYNTLSVISTMITVDETETANELIFALARYYRESLNSGEEIVDLGKEISILYDYVSILKLRKNILFDIKYSIDVKVIEYKIPKLTLQPLIENCVKYAIKDEDTMLNIEVMAKLDEKDKSCIITVRDNGVGIEEDILNAIYRGEKLNVSSGFGLKSIFERIALYYDLENPFDLIKISSKVGIGTSIEIKLPYEKEL